MQRYEYSTSQGSVSVASESAYTTTPLRQYLKHSVYSNLLRRTMYGYQRDAKIRTYTPPPRVLCSSMGIIPAEAY